MQNLIVKPSMAQATKPYFSLNMPGVDELFPGFMPGDFAILYGSSSVISLTSLLCVRAQLPPQLGGLGSTCCLHRRRKHVYGSTISPGWRSFISWTQIRCSATSIFQERLPPTNSPHSSWKNSKKP